MLSALSSAFFPLSPFSLFVGSGALLSFFFSLFLVPPLCGEIKMIIWRRVARVDLFSFSWPSFSPPFPLALWVHLIVSIRVKSAPRVGIWFRRVLSFFPFLLLPFFLPFFLTVPQRCLALVTINQVEFLCSQRSSLDIPPGRAFFFFLDFLFLACCYAMAKFQVES